MLGCLCIMIIIKNVSNLIILNDRKYSIITSSQLFTINEEVKHVKTRVWSTDLQIKKESGTTKPQINKQNSNVCCLFGNFRPSLEFLSQTDTPLLPVRDTCMVYP